MKVFNPSSGNLIQTLENEEVSSVGLPVSRVRCKPHTEGQSNNLVAAAYTSGHLRVWNYHNGNCVAQVSSLRVRVHYVTKPCDISHQPHDSLITFNNGLGTLKTKSVGGVQRWVGILS